MVKRLFQRVLDYFHRNMFSCEERRRKFLLSFVMGIFIAFSPYFGIQTLLIFLFAFLFRLDSKVVFVVVYLINNPWTMVPIFVLDYIVGVYLSTYILGLDLSKYNPVWADRLNIWLDNKFGSYISNYLDLEGLSFWNYMLGGHAVALFLAIVSYCFLVYFFPKKQDF